MFGFRFGLASSSVTAVTKEAVSRKWLGTRPSRKACFWWRRLVGLDTEGLGNSEVFKGWREKGRNMAIRKYHSFLASFCFDSINVIFAMCVEGVWAYVDTRLCNWFWSKWTAGGGKMKAYEILTITWCFAFQSFQVVPVWRTKWGGPTEKRKLVGMPFTESMIYTARESVLIKL